jgi:serine/threonine-protein kinase
MVRMMVRHATEPPPPLRQFNPAVPEGLQQVIERMLAKDPKQRYPLPLQAAQALEPFLGGAGSGPASDVGPRMQAYLQWLAANSREDEDTSPSPVAVAPAVASPPLPAPAGVAVPAPAPVLAPQPVAAAAPADVNLVPLATGSRANLLGILALVVTGIAGLAVAGAVGWMLVRWMLLR